MNDATFSHEFHALTGNPPFPWQAELYKCYTGQDGRRIPATASIPTGLGKTSVIAIWLIALANGAAVPRRLVYVVNRRTVVDQTTAEVEKLRHRLTEPANCGATAEHVTTLKSLTAKLTRLYTPHDDLPLVISTLRGQFADNRAWSANPSRPAVICGTVDMIGSRLLFSGYGVGFKAKPLHAGFLGQDAMLIHDEAHLEPAFQELLKRIEDEQCRERKLPGDLPWPKLRVMELTATSRTSTEDFTLTQDDYDHITVGKRVNAKKAVALHAQTDAKKLVDQIADLAMRHQNSGGTILVYVRGVDDAINVRTKLKKAKLQVETLTGTLRGKERDELVETAIFQRFLPSVSRPDNVEPAEGAVYLVCTSAGEVGVNISADHMVCDLSTFESMAQRFGRVNRFGERDDTCIDVVHPTTFDKKNKLTPARQATLRLLEQLGGDASPAALGKLDADQRQAAFAPEPTILPATDILFDAWALTTIRGKMPGRPPVEPYLHGLAEWEPPETHVAWREEVWKLRKHGASLENDRNKRAFETFAKDLLEDFPLKPHELLREPSYRTFKHFEAMAKHQPELPVWLLQEQGAVEVFTLSDLADKNRKDRIEGCTVILPPVAGGLTGGMLDGTSDHADDVSCGWPDKDGHWRSWTDEAGRPHRMRIWSDDKKYDERTVGMRRVRSIELESEDRDNDAEGPTWDWYAAHALEGGRTAPREVMLDTHVHDVVCHVKGMVAGLSLPQDIAGAVVLAAKLHDHGKRREWFQVTLGNRHFPERLLAKSSRKGARLPEPFRHEFASLADAAADPQVQKLSSPMLDLVLHLIAAHHGRARPHFPGEEAFDREAPAADVETRAMETPRRFARLQRRYGRWGLAYLESLLRAADWAASAAPSTFVDEPQDKP